jgi:glutathione S-transferase
MVFTLYGHPEVACMRSVTLIAKERNVPYKFITVDVKGGEQKQPVHLKHHPFGQVPYIIVCHFSTLTPLRGVSDALYFSLLSFCRI